MDVAVDVVRASVVTVVSSKDVVVGSSEFGDVVGVSVVVVVVSRSVFSVGSRFCLASSRNDVSVVEADVEELAEVEEAGCEVEEGSCEVDDSDDNAAVEDC